MATACLPELVTGPEPPSLMARVRQYPAAVWLHGGDLSDPLHLTCWAREKELLWTLPRT